MPSVYTHYRFGTRLLPGLPADVRGPILRSRALFDAGLQGPDVFFFYKPVSAGPIHALGHDLHQQSGREFFTEICKNLSPDADEATLSYLYGLLCHYCLDAVCHPLIEERIGHGSGEHNALESEFERYMLTLDGVKHPAAYRRNAHLKLNKNHYSVIRQFYPTATTGQLREAFESMVLFLGLMTCGNRVHRAMAKSVLGMMGGGKTGLLVPEDPARENLNGELLEKFNEALLLFPQMLEQLRDHLTFRGAFGPEFDHPFG